MYVLTVFRIQTVCSLYITWHMAIRELLENINNEPSWAAEAKQLLKVIFITIATKFISALAYPEGASNMESMA